MTDIVEHRVFTLGGWMLSVDADGQGALGPTDDLDEDYTVMVPDAHSLGDLRMLLEHVAASGAVKLRAEPSFVIKDCKTGPAPGSIYGNPLVENPPSSGVYRRAVDYRGRPLASRLGDTDENGDEPVDLTTIPPGKRPKVRWYDSDGKAVSDVLEAEPVPGSHSMWRLPGLPAGLKEGAAWYGVIDDGIADES